jgi:hypothetical protein
MARCGLKEDEMKGYTIEDIRRDQRTPQGLAQERWARDFKEAMHSDRDFRREVSGNFYRNMTRAAMSPSAVHTDAFLQNLSIGYRNDDYIGLQLMPVVPVDKRSDKFLKWDKRNLLNAPDDTMTHRAVPNEVEDATTSANFSVEDYALMGFVDSMTEANADTIYMDLIDQTESIAERLALKEEIRIAAIMTATGSYSGNTAPLTGVEWNEGGVPANDPVGNIQSARAALWNGFGRTRLVGFTSLPIFNLLANHTQIRGLFAYVKEGLATRQQIAAYFGLDDLLVGEARYDSANIGQTAAYARIWSNVFGIARVMTTPSHRIAAFGATFRFMPGSKTTQWFDPKPGNIGGTYTKVALSESHDVIAPDTGYLYTGVLV